MLMVFCGFGIRDLDRIGKEYSKGWGWVKLKERGWRGLKNERTKKEETEAACFAAAAAGCVRDVSLAVG
jgi:hypothetical protein